MYKIIFITILSILFTNVSFGQNKKEISKSDQESNKITSEEIVKKHLASIGTTESLLAIKSRVMIGKGEYTPMIGQGRNLSGAAQFASEGNQALFAVIFDATNDYLYEKAGFNGESVSVGLPLGNRTPLGNFIKAYPVIFKDGLIGGTLSSAWTLTTINTKKAKIEYSGKEKIDDREFYKLRYFPAKEGLLKVTLYFDSINFQHVISKYEYVLTSNLTTETTAARQRDTRYTLIEQFGDYKKVGNLTLPHRYSIDFTVQKDEVQRWNWTMNFLQIVFNESLDKNAFNVS